MTVKALIKMLSTKNPEAIVKMFDPDMEEVLPITCCTYDNNEVELFTDDVEG